MTDLEQMNVNIQRQIDAQNARIDSVMAKVDMLVVESQQQREDMRRLQERQDALAAKHAEEMKSLQERQDAKMHEMNQRFYDKIDTNQQAFAKQLHDNFVQTMIGVGAIMAAIGGLIIATLK